MELCQHTHYPHSIDFYKQQGGEGGHEMTKKRHTTKYDNHQTQSKTTAQDLNISPFHKNFLLHVYFILIFFFPLMFMQFVLRYFHSSTCY